MEYSEKEKRNMRVHSRLSRLGDNLYGLSASLLFQGEVLFSPKMEGGIIRRGHRGELWKKWYIFLSSPFGHLWYGNYGLTGQTALPGFSKGQSVWIRIRGYAAGYGFRSRRRSFEVEAHLTRPVEEPGDLTLNECRKIGFISDEEFSHWSSGEEK